MTERDRTAWFGVRCVFRHIGGLFEERVIVVKARDLDHAIERAESEAVEYAETLYLLRLEIAQAFCMADELTDGAEVFSLVRESDLEPEAYIDRFFDTGTERQRNST